MSLFPKNIRSSHVVVAGHFMALLLLVSTCDLISSEKTLSGVTDYAGREFAGSRTCAACHESIAASHAHTPHFLTSTLAADSTIKGSFDSGRNVLELNERLKVVMEKTPTGFFQRGLVNDSAITVKPVDIILGSGRNGQTYLYWDDNSLFQLPASYYTAGDTWSNSPGYPVDQLVFNRNISARCLECHSTFFRMGKSIGNLETFDRNQVMLGVDCERCHGPAADHVVFHRKYPGEKQAQNIINPAKLSRQRKLDNCALCHSGIRENLMPSFSYIVGENLRDYLYPGSPVDSAATLDVHGNQYGLLTSSKCFKMSAMDCSSCHNVHEQETNRLELFSTRCMNCHSKAKGNFCKQEEVPGLVLSENCIDCHMPALPSRQVFLRSTDNFKFKPFFFRTHLISTYDEKVRSFLAKLRAENSRSN